MRCDSLGAFKNGRCRNGRCKNQPHRLFRPTILLNYDLIRAGYKSSNVLIENLNRPEVRLISAPDQTIKMFN